MNKRTEPERARGFTLLEILCVIALVGMASMMVMLTIPGNRHQRADEYQKIKNQIQQTAQQAQLTGNVYGLRLLPDSWEIVLLQRTPAVAAQQPAPESFIAGYHWRTASRGRHLLRYPLPSGLRLTLLVGEQRFDSGQPADPAAAPQVLFLPGGEVTAFSFYLSDSTEAQAPQPVIHIDARGRMTEAERQNADAPG